MICEKAGAVGRSDWQAMATLSRIPIRTGSTVKYDRFKSTDSPLSILVTLVDENSHKMRDQQYREAMESLGKLHNMSTGAESDVTFAGAMLTVGGLSDDTLLLAVHQLTAEMARRHGEGYSRDVMLDLISHYNVSFDGAGNMETTHDAVLRRYADQISSELSRRNQPAVGDLLG